MRDDDPVMQTLTSYEPWLRFLARTEIDSRFQGKFSASDAVQQTMLAAWQGWNEFRGDNEVQRRAWLSQILAFQLAKLARHYAGTQKRNVTRERSIEASLSRSSMRLEQFFVSDQSSVSEQAVANEQSLALARALEELPGDYRQVIELRNFQDLSHEEVAQRMNRSIGAIRMLWVRALSELRRRLERDSESRNG